MGQAETSKIYPQVLWNLFSWGCWVIELSMWLRQPLISGSPLWGQLLTSSMLSTDGVCVCLCACACVSSFQSNSESRKWEATTSVFPSVWIKLCHAVCVSHVSRITFQLRLQYNNTLYIYFFHDLLKHLKQTLLFSVCVCSLVWS